MGLKRALARLAARARVPVFPVPGIGGRAAAQDLRLADAVEVVMTPRAANLLVVVGAPHPAHVEALRRVHDAVSYPRATVFRGTPEAADRLRRALPGIVVVEPADDLPEALGRIHRDLLAGRRESAAPVLPDEDPAPWRGVGPYDQGGSGMTGGVPYGRPMADRAESRDGLSLDRLSVRLGPFLPPLPSGLVLDVEVQGDVFEAVTIVSPSPGDTGDTEASVAGRGTILAGADPNLAIFLRALHEPVRIADFEVARARSHLRWLSAALVAVELPALGERALRLAGRVGPGDGEAIRRLARLVRWSRALGWATRGVGHIEADEVAGRGVGPVARACGLAEDLRSDDPMYAELGFEPVTESGGDAAARWRVRLAEATDSLALAARAGDRTTMVTGQVEGPRGVLEPGSAPAGRLASLVGRRLVGMEWGDAITTVLSLDLDMDEPVLLGLPEKAPA